jgi:tetratricopeptide (TPR) repeat protein
MASSVRIVSCILASYLAFGAASVTTLAQGAIAPVAKAPDGADPDALYAQREDITKAKQAADLWEARSLVSKDYEALWKLSRIAYYLGTLGPKEEQQAELDRGINAGKQASDLEPNKPDGLFWWAANMGEMAQKVSMFSAKKYVDPMKGAFEKIIALQPGWQDGSAESALGQWYIQVPGNLFCCGGDKDKGITWLRKALTYNSESSNIRYSLAEVLSEDGKTRPEAIDLLHKVLAAPIDPDWAPEDKNFKVKAQMLLDKLNKK